MLTIYFSNLGPNESNMHVVSWFKCWTCIKPKKAFTWSITKDEHSGCTLYVNNK